MHDMCDWCLQRPEEGVGSPGAGVLVVCWESNQGHLKDQPVLLTDDPFLQPLLSPVGFSVLPFSLCP